MTNKKRPEFFEKANEAVELAEIHIHGTPEIVHKMEKLKKENEILRTALQFYCIQKYYEYDSDQKANYMWNDQGRISRVALEQADKIRDSK